MSPTFRELTNAIQAELRSAIPVAASETIKPGADAITAEPHDMLALDAHRQSLQNVLQKALHTAAALEFATIPPYLTALWSIKDQNQPIARSIRSIIHEEMLHLALVNNLLVGIGGQPKITGPDTPSYPSKLPGGVHPELTVTLGGLDAENLDIFLEIERPEVVVPIEGQPDPTFPDDDTTIGEFYEMVRKAAQSLNPEFDVDHQIAGPLAPMVIADLATMDKAIDLIRTQGEGAAGIPYDRNPEDLAHYYRFKEVQLKRRLIWDEDSKVLRLGEKLSDAAIYKLAPVPPGGYGDQFPQSIHDLSAEFNREYSRMLNTLEDAWASGGQAALVRSVEYMFRLRPIAQEMIRSGGPKGGYTPEFRYIPNAA